MPRITYLLKARRMPQDARHESVITMCNDTNAISSKQHCPSLQRCTAAGKLITAVLQNEFTWQCAVARHRIAFRGTSWEGQCICSHVCDKWHLTGKVLSQAEICLTMRSTTSKTLQQEDFSVVRYTSRCIKRGNNPSKFVTGLYFEVPKAKDIKWFWWIVDDHSECEYEYDDNDDHVSTCALKASTWTMAVLYIFLLCYVV